MIIHIDLYVHHNDQGEPYPGLLQVLENIERRLDTLARQGETMFVDLTNLTAAVNNETTVADSAIVLIQGLAAEISAAGTDPVALQALQDKLNNSATSLAAAVAANTPAAPTATPVAGVAQANQNAQAAPVKQKGYGQ